MSTITVFWIEDNPIIKNEETINGLKYPKFLHTENFNYFLFQHPKQVHEFLSMTSEAAASGVTAYLAEKCPSALPDIVVFDYKLFDAFSRNENALQYTKESHSDFLKGKSASQRLKEAFDDLFKNKILFLDIEDVSMGRYMGDKFKAEIKAEKILSDDEFGLYCGIAIVREFKEYTTVGVPATINKIDKTTMSYNSLFYEWINSYDLKGAIERPVIDAGNKSKDWTHILKFAVDLLRTRIKTQLQSNKITPSLTQLLEYAGGEIPTEPDQRIFTFQSAYGARHLPLDGLFIDVEQDGRNKAIKEWINVLLGTITSSLPVLQDTIKSYKSIYDTYKTKFLNRILLSDFSKREEERKLGSYEKLYKDLKSNFGVGINGKIGDDNLCSVEYVFAGNKGKKKKIRSEDDKSKLRLLVLFLCIRLWIDHQNGAKKQADGIPLTKEDYYYVLNPVMNTTKGDNPLLLCMHSDISESVYVDAFQKFLKRSCSDIPETTWDNFEWITAGERVIMNSFFQPELSKMEKYPGWLS